MSKVTSKLQVTVPKVVADQYGIRPGDEIEWIPAGDSVRIVPSSRSRPPLPLDLRLELFDQATARQRERQERAAPDHPARGGRGRTRDELYDRG